MNSHILRAIALPVMALGGLVAIISVFVGLQCGGLDKCFVAHSATPTVAVEAAEEPVPPEPRLTPDTPLVATADAAPVAAVAMTRPPAASAETARAERADEMIGDTFAAIASDDEGWLNGAHSAPGADSTDIAPSPTTVAESTDVAQDPTAAAENQIEEGDGAGPLPPEDGSAAEALVAAAGEAAVMPLERPTPLQVAAFAEAAAPTEPKVQSAAEQKLAEVAGSTEAATEPEVATELAVEPEPKSQKPAEPTKQVAAVAGDTRTVGGAGVNVRSGPGKSNGKLFALAGGEKVKVGENQRGWLRITDDQGRTGWVYKTYLN